MNRRQLMKTVVAGATAARGGKASPQARPVTKPADSWKPRFLDFHQNQTVVALTGLIIPATDTPGAKAALVNRFIDLMLAEGPAEAARAFVQGLAWLDGYALRTHGAPFLRCTPRQQTALLSALDPATNAPSALRPGVQFFQDIKRRTVIGYYTSKTGFDELNKGGRVPATYGCTHEAH